MPDYMQYLEDINVKFSLLLPSKVPYKKWYFRRKNIDYNQRYF